MRSIAPTSWAAPPRSPVEGARPSWLAPPAPPEPSLTSWAAPAPYRKRLIASVAPRISMAPAAPRPLGEDSDRVPPPPSLPEIEQQVTQAVSDAEAQRLGALVEELRVGLEAAQASVADARRAALEDSEREIVKLAMAIAERVVGRALAEHESDAATWVREGLKALAHEDDVRCVASPRLAEVLMACDDWFEGEARPDVVVDTRLEGLSCEVRGRYGKVDASVGARLDAVARALETERVRT